MQVRFHGGTVAAAAAMIATFVQSGFSEGTGCLLFQH